MNSPAEDHRPSTPKKGGLFSSMRGTNNGGGGAGVMSATAEALNSLRVPRNAGSPQRELPDQDETSIVRGMSDLKVAGTNKENVSPSTGVVPNQPPQLSARDLEKVSDPKVRRLVNVAQLYFFDYYFDMLTYIHSRNQRLNRAHKSLQSVPPEERDAQWRSYTGRERALLRKRRVKLKYGDFKMLTQVGQGGYGQVYLAQKSDTKEICALKVLNKRLLLKLDEIRHILTERDILTAARSPWLTKLLYSFQDNENVYLAMEFVPGGDYRTLLNNTGILSPRHARFYISEMFASLDSLHKLGYIHRDLKPENFLIDAAGHIKLTDFGLAAGAISQERVESMRVRLDQVKDLQVPYRSVNERQKMYKSLRRADIDYANSIVGSPDYMALEVLQGKDYNHTIDYWSLGCMLFETLSGYPPFAGSTTDETYANLQQWKRALRRPQYEDGKFVFSDRTWDFIQHCITSPRYRFNTFGEIRQHVYFAEVNWETLRESSPPFVPQLDSEADAGYFDDFTNDADMAKYKEVMDKRTQVENLADRGTPLSSRAFIGFTFRHSKNVNVLEETRSGNTTNSRSALSQKQPSHHYDTSFGTIF